MSSLVDYFTYSVIYYYVWIVVIVCSVCFINMLCFEWSLNTSVAEGNIEVTHTLSHTHTHTQTHPHNTHTHPHNTHIQTPTQHTYTYTTRQ